MDSEFVNHLGIQALAVKDTTVAEQSSQASVDFSKQVGAFMSNVAGQIDGAKAAFLTYWDGLQVEVWFALQMNKLKDASSMQVSGLQQSTLDMEEASIQSQMADAEDKFPLMMEKVQGTFASEMRTLQASIDRVQASAQMFTSNLQGKIRSVQLLAGMLLRVKRLFCKTPGVMRKVLF